VIVETQYLPNADLWVHDLATGARRRLTSGATDESYPVWSPDGARIAYSAQRERRDKTGQLAYRVEIIRGDGAGEPVAVLADTATDVFVLSWSGDGKALLVGRGQYRGYLAGTLWRLTLADRKLEPVLPISQIAAAASFSPDGRWIAFSSLTTGRAEVSVIAAPKAGEAPDPTARQWPVTSMGGDKPVWRRDSRELYYMRQDGTLMAVGVDGAAGEFHVLSEHALFQAFQRDFVHSYDVAPDGQHFVVIVAGSEGGAPLAVVTNWTRALRRR
jgi:Tol biopolymer transport system component